MVVLRAAGALGVSSKIQRRWLLMQSPVTSAAVALLRAAGALLEVRPALRRKGAASRRVSKRVARRRLDEPSVEVEQCLWGWLESR